MLFPKPDGIFEPALGACANSQPKAVTDIRVNLKRHIDASPSQRMDTPFHR